MYSYCLCNPINYYDSCGSDAIWLYEEDSARGAGHVGLMIEDESGDWWFFYWGPTDENGSVINMIMPGVTANCVLVKLEVDNADLTTVIGVKNAIKSSSGTGDVDFAKQRVDLISSIAYYKGDYYDTLNWLKELDEDVSRGKRNTYNLIINNCVQNSWRAMAFSNPNFKKHDTQLIPLIDNIFARGIAIYEKVVSFFTR